ncbi:MAG: YetF domain-containing protein [Dongiaceae bacterium]
MFELELAWWEPVARAAIIYLAVLLLLRLTGKRQIGDLTPFDILLLLLISEGVSNALNGGDTSLVGGGMTVTTLLALNWTIGGLATRWRRFDRALEGRPQLLIRDGKVDYALLRQESISNNELLAALRSAACFTPHQAEYAVLESSGQISVRRKGTNAK